MTVVWREAGGTVSMDGGQWYMRTRAPMESLSALHLSVQAEAFALAHLESWCGGGPPGGTTPTPRAVLPHVCPYTSAHLAS